LCHCHRKTAASAVEDLAATIPHLDTLTADIGVERFEFCQAFNRYLARLGPDAPVKNLREFLADGRCHASIKGRLERYTAMEDGMQSAE
jgi:hypothetical protein